MYAHYRICVYTWICVHTHTCIYAYRNTSIHTNMYTFIYETVRYSVHDLEFQANKIHKWRLIYNFPLHLFSKILPSLYRTFFETWFNQAPLKSYSITCSPDRIVRRLSLWWCGMVKSSLTAIRLSHGQFWAILEKIVSLTWC